jgi:hypothetical protein
LKRAFNRNLEFYTSSFSDFVQGALHINKQGSLVHYLCCLFFVPNRMCTLSCGLLRAGPKNMHLCFWWYVTKLLSLLFFSTWFLCPSYHSNKKCLFQLGFSNLGFVKLLFWDVPIWYWSSYTLKKEGNVLQVIWHSCWVGWFMLSK